MSTLTRSERTELLRRQSLIVGVMLLALALHWWGLLGHLREKHDDLIVQTGLRAQQIASSLAAQVNTRFAGINVLVNYLAGTYATQSPAAYDALVQTIQRSYPAGTIYQVLIADAQGNVIYVSPDPSGQRVQPPGNNIDTHTYFRPHLESAASALFIDQPEVIANGRTIVRVSRPMRIHGVLTGVIALAIDTAWLSSPLEDILYNANDLVLLLRNSDGAYLARVHGKVAQPKPPFLHNFSVHRDTVEPAQDWVERMYGWHTVDDFPLLVSVGLDMTALRVPLQQDRRIVLRRNTIITVAALTVMLLIQYLSWRNWHSARRARRSEMRLQQTMHAVNDGMWECNLSDASLVLNRRCGEILGYNVEQMPLRLSQLLALTHPDDRRKLQQHVKAHLASQDVFQQEFRLRHRDGRWVWVEARGNSIAPADGLPTQLLGTLRDNDANYRAREALYIAQQRLTSIIERFPGYVMVQEPSGPIAAINPALAELLRHPDTDAEPTNIPENTQVLLDRLYRLLPEEVRGLIAQSGRDSNVSCEFALPDGRHFELHRIVLSTPSQELGIFWMARDITVTKHREMSLVQQAQTDALTGLPNRRALTERIQHTLYAIRSGEQSAGALLVLDIDFFKQVNDTWGHAVGDEVLCHLSAQLRNTFHRSGDLSGRWGGEEFAILLPQTTLDNAKRLAENLRSTVAKQPAMTSRGPVPITISIGIAPLHVHLGSIREAMIQADTALYQAKNQGRDTIAVWSAE